MKLKCYFCAALYDFNEIFKINIKDDEESKCVLICNNCDKQLGIRKNIIHSLRKFFNKNKNKDDTR